MCTALFTWSFFFRLAFFNVFVYRGEVIC